MLRDNIAVCEMVITTYAHRLPNIKEVLRPLFDYSREISHGDVTGIMHDSQYVVELHKIAPQPDLASLTPEEKELFAQILANSDDSTKVKDEKSADNQSFELIEQTKLF